MKNLIWLFCALIFLISTAVKGQNDSIWITDAGGIILTVGLRAHDTLTNGWIYKAGDTTSICYGSSITLILNASYASIHHVFWQANIAPQPSPPNSFSITVSPTVNTDYSGYVYEDVGGVSTYRGMVKIRVMIAPNPQTFNWILDNVIDEDTAHYCAGEEIMQYSDSEIGAIYQLMDGLTNNPVGSTVNGSGGQIDLPAMPGGTYYLFIDNGVCTIFDY